MTRDDALQGSLDLLLLTILSPRLHGYAMMAAIVSASGEVLRRRTRVYKLTAAGKERPVAEESHRQSVSLAINRILRRALREA